MSGADRDRRPNVLWIFGDQHRGQALSCAGDPNVATPNIDRLAAEGVQFTAAVAGVPLCCPFRGSLLSGRYPHQCVPGHEYPLPEGMPTIARPFNDAGYDTAWFGKWHVDGHKEREGRGGKHRVAPHRRGEFRTWLGYENNNSQWDVWVHGHQGDEEIPLERLPGFETDALTDRLLDYLRDRAGGPPFFAVLSVQPPHDPYTAPAEWMRRHNPARLELRPNVPRVPRIEEQARRELAGYYALIENLDHNLGRIRQTLFDLGLADNTHIIFFSDHGDLHGSHGQFRKTAPWEESVRVPFILGGVTKYEYKSHQRQPAPLNHVDIAPTTLGLCGLTPPAWLPGCDYSGYRLKDKPVANEPDSAFLQSVIPTMHGDSIDRPWRGVVTRDGWKYVCLEGQPWLLHNLAEDPYELVNLAHNSKYRVRRRQLQDRLAQWLADTGDQFTLPEL